MSKKQGKNQPEKKVLQIVDQQKDPMLRSLQKKVRNINKKLTQISELETKKDLKPEQEDKISKKAQISQQKQKYLEMIEIYKEIAAQNQKIIRKAQLVELEDLASTLAVKEYSVDLGVKQNQSIDNLVRLLTSSTSNQLSLQDRIKQISFALNEYAKNIKLKKNVKDYVLANPNKKKPNFQAVSNQPQPISPQSQQQRQEQLKQLEEQQKFEASQKAVQPLTPNIAVTLHNNETVGPVSTTQAPQNIQQIVVQKVNSQQNPPANADNQPSTQVQGNAQNSKPAETNGRKDGRKQYRGYRSGKGRQSGRDGGRNYEDRKYNKKPNFKPKYEEKQQKDQRRESSSSSSSSSESPKARQFKRQEVRQLIEDGFIVVGKPKIKARDQKDFHDHQHGNKHHKHHTKKNY